MKVLIASAWRRAFSAIVRPIGRPVIADDSSVNTNILLSASGFSSTRGLPNAARLHGTQDPGNVTFVACNGVPGV